MDYHANNAKSHSVNRKGKHRGKSGVTSNSSSGGKTRGIKEYKRTTHHSGRDRLRGQLAAFRRNHEDSKGKDLGVLSADCMVDISDTRHYKKAWW